MTDKEVRNAERRDKPYKLSEAGGAGKNTLAIHLAGAAERKAQTGLIIETDPGDRALAVCGGESAHIVQRK